MPLLRDVRDDIGSAYLLSHVDNPVDWHTWSSETLDEAQRLGRPVFLSIGYAACHWCHVMAHESFEDAAIATALNDSFVAVKVDREERPDVDELYMAATQLVSGHGGWPMSVFLLPDGRPFMAGTYYPPEDRPGQVGFPRLLGAMADAWANRREAVIAQASELERALRREIAFVDHLALYDAPLDLTAARRALRDDLVARVDAEGGFGPAPKFPRPSYVEALLEFEDDGARAAVARTLDAMARRGLYDHLEGGFARYSVDAHWHVPHFEKMLSDQALLSLAYLRAARRVPRSEWRAVARDTLDFVCRDLRVDAGFASSLDADAGGVEGSHVTWTVDEVARALDEAGCGGDLDRVLARWRIVDPGLFEGRSIPRLADDEPFGVPDDLLGASRALRTARARRPQPARDEKVVLEWNAMLARAFLAVGEARFDSEAIRLLDSLARTHFSQGTWWRTERRSAHATASDVAWLLDAFVDAFEVTSEDRWLTRGADLASTLLSDYWDGPVPTPREPRVGAGLFTQSALVSDLPARPKEIFDGATPSSHAVGCRALARLALVTGDAELLCVARRLVELGATLVANRPGAVPDLVDAAGFALEGLEIVIPGEPGRLVSHVRSMDVPRSVLVTGSGSSPLLRDREPGRAYVCRSGVCRLPVDSTAELDDELEAMR